MGQKTKVIRQQREPMRQKKREQKRRDNGERLKSESRGTKA